MAMVDLHGLKIDSELHDFIVNEAITGTGVDADHFFRGFAELIHDLGPKNRALLAKRDALQEQIDGWYRGRSGDECALCAECRQCALGFAL